MRGTAAIQEAIETMLARYRGQAASPTREDIDRIYTDGCAAVLALEAERLRLKRRVQAAVMDAAEVPESVQEAAALSERSADLSRELAELKQLVRQLRTAVDWAQLDAQDGSPAGPPRRRFRRR